jgi:hypothetical protein
MTDQQAQIKELRLRFNILASHLGGANTHLHYFLRLEEARKNYDKSFVKSYDFWEYTKLAHLETATFCLCRIYDEHGCAIQLHRFLNEIPKNGLDEVQKNLLQTDKAFCCEKSKVPAIEKLRHWRNHFGAHYNYQLTTFDGRRNLTGLKSKIAKTPSFTELQQLIDKGFEILERWASFYKSSSDFQKLIKDKDDYLFVLDAIQTKQIQMRIKR